MGRIWAALAAAIGLGLLATPALAQAPRPQAPSDTSAAAQTTRPDWVSKPSGDDMDEAYPPLAQALGVTGRVVIHCQVATTGRVEDCRVESETPKGFGFGAAALKISPLFQMAPATLGGSAKVSEVRIPLRFAMPEGDHRGDVAAILAGLSALAILALALAVNDWIRGRSAPRMPVGAAVAYALNFAARCWRRAPGPLVLYLLLAVGEAVWSSREGAPPGLQPAVTALSFIVGLMISGSGLRLGFSDLRPDDPYYRPGALGLKFGAVELRVLASGLVQGLVIVTGLAGLALVGVVLMAIVRATIADEARQSIIGGVFGAVAVVVALCGALRLWTFTPAAVYRRRLPLAEAWGATRAALFSPLAAVLLICLIGLLAALVPLVGGVVLGAVLKIETGANSGAAGGGLMLAIVQPALVGLQVFAFKTLHRPQEGTPEP